ncbi:hypothetical protein GCM10009718_23270 [Isoptericola halotolerans]|uniref:CHAT domain-containing protein n=1 Tax=Isoptericola halotolerans TaxID=300560 RepID=A0ABX2A637_9MICO|nr:hypothetical protein [Isoptericola halotolerans]NOV98109.1 hypothetical protein [Isoptericola halotolerans]
MAKNLRTEIALPTLRISVDLARADAVFATAHDRARPQEVARCPLRDLGLPSSVDGPVADAALTVPAEVVARLDRAARELGTSPLPPAQALWLEFPAPRGLVHVLPWERLLASLERPLFRLPYHPVRPQKPGPRLDVAICASSPFRTTAFDPAEVLAHLSAQYLRHAGRDVTVHLFTDAAHHAATRAAVESMLSYDHTLGAFEPPIVHEPPGRPRHPSSSHGSHAITNPWLTWLSDGVDGGRLDVVHLVAHGSMSSGRGSVALATTPRTEPGTTPARFVEAVELVELLTRVGALGLALSSPPGNRSAAGLRELADDVARVRPGVAAVHDLADDPEARQLGAALRMVFAPSQDQHPPLPAMAAWVHPLFVGRGGLEAYADDVAGPLRELTSTLLLDEDGRSSFLQPATRRSAAEVDSESWVASASRSIEQLQMAWLPPSLDLPVDRAAVEALDRVAGLLEQHAHLAYPDDPGGAAGGGPR